MTKNWHDPEYLDLLYQVYKYGETRTDRTGVGTRGVFTGEMTFNLEDTFPLLTTKRVYWKGVVHELLWFLSGDTNIKYLVDNDVHIWDEWADADGDLGPVYGAQWRHWAAPDGTYVDQIKNLIDGLKNDPHSRRHIVTAWNPAEIGQMKLPPCHMLFQFWVSQADNSLHCQLHMRSADLFLGIPFNIASYALLTCILADTLGFERGTFNWTGGDIHIYSNHLEQVEEQLSRYSSAPASPVLKKIPGTDPLAVRFEDIVLEGYKPLAAIKADVAV